MYSSPVLSHSNITGAPVDLKLAEKHPNTPMSHVIILLGLYLNMEKSLKREFLSVYIRTAVWNVTRYFIVNQDSLMTYI